MFRRILTWSLVCAALSFCLGAYCLHDPPLQKVLTKSAVEVLEDRVIDRSLLTAAQQQILDDQLQTILWNDAMLRDYSSRVWWGAPLGCLVLGLGNLVIVFYAARSLRL